ncbi:MAG TPA: hypothetical protein VG963_15490, partial [Polyangiaceae bacterium]|nr:hypothetical protein [Polyangiaceae bacterium]
MAASCGATLGLARGGLLDDRLHASGALEYLAASGYKGASNYRSERAVTDGNLITAGPTGALESARHIFHKLDYFVMFSGELRGLGLARRCETPGGPILASDIAPWQRAQHAMPPAPV